MSKIAIYAGHGGPDSGAVGQKGELEKDYTLKISSAAINYLRSAGHEVITNRTADVKRDITADANKANVENADCVVEIHLNSNSGTPATGSEVFYSITGGDGKALAQAILDKIVSLGYKSRGIKTKTNSAGKDYFGIIRQTKAPAVLVEVCFINNPEDMARLDCEAAGKAVAQGVMAVFGGAESGTEAVSPAQNVPVKETAATGKTAGDDTVIKSIQSTMNKRYEAGIKVDGIYGPKTKSALVRGLQTELNKQYGKGVAVDGIFGSKTKAACVTVSKGASGSITYILQTALYCSGFNPGDIDGIFGGKTLAAVKSFQKSKGITVDGKAGKNTFEKLFG